MSGRSSRITRVRDYFRSAEIDEAEVVLTLVQKDVAARTAPLQEPLPFHKKPRKPRARKVGKPGDEPAERTIPNAQTNEPVSA